MHFNNRRVGVSTANNSHNSGDHADEGEGDGVEEGGNESRSDKWPETAAKGKTRAAATAKGKKREAANRKSDQAEPETKPSRRGASLVPLKPTHNLAIFVFVFNVYGLRKRSQKCGSIV